MDDNKIEPFKGFESSVAHQKIFEFTKLQMKSAVAITPMIGASCLIAFAMTRHDDYREGAPFVALYSIFLGIGLFASLSKGDTPIHTLAEELYQIGDWHEAMRKLFRFGWLNPLQDVLGFLPTFLAFILANGIIWHYWNFLVPSWFVILVDSILFAGSAALIPISSDLAHKEVRNQMRKFAPKLFRE